MKKIASILSIIFVLVLLTGCTTSKSYTYNVETGDKVKIELNTTNGYDLTSKLPFTIYKGDNTLSQGTFITMDGYNQYIDVVNRDPDSKILDNGNKNGITYTFYSYKNEEFNYIIKINNSNTGLLLGNPNSRKEAEEVFDRLTFSIEK
jgi:hypothetical protein